MIARELQKKIIAQSKKIPVIALVGPRQSGKTTLARAAFPKLEYVSLEDFDVQTLAKDDPRGFLLNYTKGVIIDEAQKVPELFSYLQSIIDNGTIKGPVILTGSQNFLLHEKISQSLAGRVALFSLLPLSMKEIKKSGMELKIAQEFILKGGYPRLYDKNISPSDWIPSYIQTYLERDVRSIQNILDLSLFQRFLVLCAGRIGQLFNASSLAVECGISVTTVHKWIGLLESSFILYLLRPHHKNLNKRVVKSPKLYFYDTAIACSILGIDTQNHLKQHYIYGNLFENMVLNEMIKTRFNSAKRNNMFFWRDKTGHEIDCLVENPISINAIEIKSSQTISPRFFDGLNYWKTINKNENRNSFYVVYGGEKTLVRNGIKIIPWYEIGGL